MDNLNLVFKNFTNSTQVYDKLLEDYNDKKQFQQIIKNHMLQMIERFISQFESKDFQNKGDYNAEEETLTYRKFIEDQKLNFEQSPEINIDYDQIKYVHSPKSTDKPINLDPNQSSEKPIISKYDRGILSPLESKKKINDIYSNSTVLKPSDDPKTHINSLPENEISLSSPTKNSKITNLSKILKSQHQMRKMREDEEEIKNEQSKRFQTLKNLITNGKSPEKILKQMETKIKSGEIDLSIRQNNYGNEDQSSSHIISQSLNEKIALNKNKTYKVNPQSLALNLNNNFNKDQQTTNNIANIENEINPESMLDQIKSNIITKKEEPKVENKKATEMLNSMQSLEKKVAKGIEKAISKSRSPSKKQEGQETRASPAKRILNVKPEEPEESIDPELVNEYIKLCLNQYIQENQIIEPENVITEKPKKVKKDKNIIKEKEKDKYVEKDKYNEKQKEKEQEVPSNKKKNITKEFDEEVIIPQSNKKKIIKRDTDEAPEAPFANKKKNKRNLDEPKEIQSIKKKINKSNTDISMEAPSAKKKINKEHSEELFYRPQPRKNSHQDSLTSSKKAKEEASKEIMELAKQESTNRKRSMRVSVSSPKIEADDQFEKMQERISGRQISEKESREFMRRNTKSQSNLLVNKYKEKEHVKNHKQDRIPSSWATDSALTNIRYEQM